MGNRTEPSGSQPWLWDDRRQVEEDHSRALKDLQAEQSGLERAITQLEGRVQQALEETDLHVNDVLQERPIPSRVDHSRCVWKRVRYL